jgi:hypothetical protein
MARAKRPAISDEEKERWSAKEYPKREMLWLKGWLHMVDVALPGLLAREASEEWLRAKPDGKKLLLPKQSPKKRRDIKTGLREALEDLRRCGFHELADICQVSRPLARQAAMLRAFAVLQEERYGKAEDRPSELLVGGDEITPIIEALEKKRRAHEN